MESESSSNSSTSDVFRSSACAKNQKKSKCNKWGRAKVLTENHLKVRAVVDAGSTWELDLEQVHGLTDEEACILVSKIAPHMEKKTFPDPKGDRFTEFAKERGGSICKMRIKW